MRVIDEIIGDELDYYRDILRGGSLEEILQMLG